MLVDDDAIIAYQLERRHLAVTVVEYFNRLTGRWSKVQGGQLRLAQEEAVPALAYTTLGGNRLRCV